jgi:hypothetical protein
VVSLGLVGRGLDLAHLALDRRLLCDDRRMMLVTLDTERFAQRRQQMVFVHLRVALHRFVLDVFRQLAQFSDGLLLELFIRVRHATSRPPLPGAADPSATRPPPSSRRFR